MLVTKWYRPRNIRSMWFGEGEGEGGGGEGGGTGEGGAGGEGGDKGASGAGGAGKGTGTGAGKAEKVFKQADVDRIIDARFKKEREEKEKLIQQLETFKESANLTAAEKENLAQQIGDLQASLRTKEETAAIQLKTVEGKYQSQIKTLGDERDTWKNRFVDSTIKRNVSDAAIANDAEDPSQIVMMFGSQTRLEEEKGSDGKPTGNYITMMKFQGIDPETKKPTMMDLPPAEAFQHMRENGLHKNLWKHGGKPGTGTNAGGSGGKSSNPSKEPQIEDYNGDSAAYSAAYQKWRDEYEVDGTPRRKGR